MRTAHHRLGVRVEVYKVNKVETRLKVASGALQKGGKGKIQDRQISRTSNLLKVANSTRVYLKPLFPFCFVRDWLNTSLIPTPKGPQPLPSNAHIQALLSDCRKIGTGPRPNTLSQQAT
jgi:hypothetical protein